MFVVSCASLVAGVRKLLELSRDFVSLAFLMTR